MEYTLVVHPKAGKNLERLQGRDKLRVETVLSLVRSNPFQGKKLKGKYRGYYSVRSWPYRIVYKILEVRQLIIVAEITHRGHSYRSKLL
ncbi:MAG: type II toxin-antitoxin system RelE/ParE family toxin [Candidatus Wildermuthbacteria bacterium]|nr:type II toxin-antitoxin system RelE/ParE family toxin [Candidatus Wildermuthbacteria bacterium]